MRTKVIFFESENSRSKGFLEKGHLGKTPRIDQVDGRNESIQNMWGRPGPRRKITRIKSRRGNRGGKPCGRESPGAVADVPPVLKKISSHGPK